MTIIVHKVWDSDEEVDSMLSNNDRQGISSDCDGKHNDEMLCTAKALELIMP